MKNIKPVVQILDEDNISKDYFLEPESENLINNELINKEIYIPQYIEGLKLKNAEGIIKDIFDYEFSHLANTQEGSSGSPIFLKDSDRVIGIHKAGIRNKENFGDFIYPVINIITEDIIKRNNNGKYINNKYIYNDGKMIYQMVKELNIIKMEIYYMKVILLMDNSKEMEKLF